MQFPQRPEVLNLTQLEERLISPRIPFMQIRELPRGCQLSIHGNVVNVPAEVNLTVNSLPRSLNDSQTIPIKLKRKLTYKHHYKFQNVRPKKVLDAAKYLADTSELFKAEGVTIKENWIDTLVQNDGEMQELIENDKESVNNEISNESAVNNETDESTSSKANNNCLNSDNDNWCEVEERPSGNMDTLLQEPMTMVMILLALHQVKAINH